MKFLSILTLILISSYVSIAEIEVKHEMQNCFAENDRQLNDNKVSTLSPSELSQILIEGSHSFAFDLLKALHKFEAKENSTGLLLSPSSVWSALLITYMAAKGETESELQNKLRLKGIGKPSVGMAYQGLRLWNDLKRNMSKMSDSMSDKTVLSQANRIFVNNETKLNNCFQEYFEGDITQMDFESNPSKSVKEINDWVRDQTNGKITDIVPNGAVNPWTKIIITNAVYFQSKWLHQFNKELSTNSSFFVSPTDETVVQLMTLETTLMYGISEKLQATAIELPYANPDYSMLVILPDVGRGLDSMITAMTASDLYDLVANMYDDEVTVQLPKFKVNQQFELAGPLYSIGIRNLFDPRFADLSLLFDSSNNNSVDLGEKKRDHFALNSVVHKSYIAVDEEGTEAAAATAMIYARSGRPVFKTQFVANRPFLYLIRDVSTNFILFLGTVRKPMQ